MSKPTRNELVLKVLKFLFEERVFADGTKDPEPIASHMTVEEALLYAQLKDAIEEEEHEFGSKS